MIPRIDGKIREAIGWFLGQETDQRISPLVRGETREMDLWIDESVYNEIGIFVEEQVTKETL